MSPRKNERPAAIFTLPAIRGGLMSFIGNSCCKLSFSVMRSLPGLSSYDPRLESTVHLHRKVNRLAVQVSGLVFPLLYG